jgi:predicted negative regulator of RcsB-dependent stress response
MQYRLRTLLIVLAIGPVVLAGAWFGWQEWQREQRRRMAEERLENLENEIR